MPDRECAFNHFFQTRVAGFHQYRNCRTNLPYTRHRQDRQQRVIAVRLHQLDVDRYQPLMQAGQHQRQEGTRQHRAH